MQKIRRRITKKLVDQLGPKQTFWDSEVRGFGIRRQVYDKVFILKCSHDGKRRFFTIGHFGSPWTDENARSEALRLLGSLKAGIYQSEPDTNEQPITMTELCARYLVDHADRHKKKRSAHSDRRNIANHVIPILGQKSVVEIKKRDVELFRDSVHDGVTAPDDIAAQRKINRGGKSVTGGKGVANRCLTLLSKMFNLAEDWGFRPQHSNPVRRVLRYKETTRQRYLSQAELIRIGKALSEVESAGTIDLYAAAAIRLLIFTGARTGEILSLRWEYVDEQRRVLLLPDSKTGQKTIRLSSAALTILQSVPMVESNPFVCVGRKSGKPLVNIQKSWKRVCELAGVQPTRLHDLRHTFASIAVAQNLSLATVGALLTHTSQQTTSRYAHLQSDHISDANEKISNVIRELLNQ